jgi:LysM repeat protein
MDKKYLIIFGAIVLLIALFTALTTFQTPDPQTANNTTPVSQIKYIVKEGDTCTKIAHDHKTTIDSIVELNGLRPECKILVGQLLILAAPQP